MWKALPGTLYIPLNNNVFTLRKEQQSGMQKQKEKELSHEKNAIGS